MKSRSLRMKRRDFLKYVALSPLAGIAIAKERPTEKDEVWADLRDCSDHGFQGAAFIRFEGMWFFSDRNSVKWCPVEKLNWKNWKGYTLPPYDAFEFWQWDEGKLFWCGKHTRWEVRRHPVCEVEFCFDRYL